MSRYDALLIEAKKKGQGTAQDYIQRLYDILIQEEKKSTNDARDIIERDLVDTWSKATIRKFLPEAVKDEVKVEAGKKGAEEKKKKVVVAAGGESVLLERNLAGSDSVDEKEAKSGSYTPPEIEKVKTVFEDIEDEDEQTKDKRLLKMADIIKDKDLLLEQKDKTIAQLNEVVKKDSFKPAIDEMHTKSWDRISNPVLLREIRMLQSQGWHFIKARLEFVS